MSVLDSINPYAVAMRVRRDLYHSGVLKSEHVGIPTIAIGNLTTGGAGKTPLTIAVAQHLLRKGKRVAIVSRGYRRASKGFVLVQEGTQVLASVTKSGDEAQLMAIKLPKAIVIVDEDRVHGARQAKNLGADVVVLDDAFQHMRIRRDLNVLVVDSSRTFAEVLPFGMLREPLAAARDADAIVYTNADRAIGETGSPLAKLLSPNALSVRTRIKASTLLPLSATTNLPQASLNGVRVLAVSSIAGPQRFHQTLRDLGAVVTPHVLRDHARYDNSTIERIRKHALRSASEAIITTEKDGVKSASFFGAEWDGPPVHMLAIELEFIEGGDAFYKRIDSITL